MTSSTAFHLSTLHHTSLHHTTLQFVKRHRLKIASVALALIAIKSVAGPAPLDPAVRLQTTFDKVETSLALSDEQAALWNSAETATLAMLKAGFERRKSVHDTLLSTLAESSPDVHALSQTLLTDMESHLTENKQNHEAWLNVYDSLSTDQQALARQALLAELAKMEKMHRMGPPPAKSSRRAAATPSSF